MYNIKNISKGFEYFISVKLASYLLKDKITKQFLSNIKQYPQKLLLNIWKEQNKLIAKYEYDFYIHTNNKNFKKVYKYSNTIFFHDNYCNALTDYIIEQESKGGK